MTRLIFVTLLAAQTVITPPENKYSPAEDVKLGQQASAEAERQLPLMHDDAISSYVDQLGRRLVDAIPPEFMHPEFRYTFKTVNVREINAFALPGGPMFVNRGMLEAAGTEGGGEGVMAHALRHVVLCPGTPQATQAPKTSIGPLSPAPLWAIHAGRA